MAKVSDWRAKLGVQLDHNRHLEEVIPYDQQKIAIDEQSYRGQQFLDLPRPPSSSLPRIDLDEHERQHDPDTALSRDASFWGDDAQNQERARKTLRQHFMETQIQEGYIQGPLPPLSLRLYNLITGIVLSGWKNAKSTADVFEVPTNRYTAGQKELPSFIGTLFYGFGRLAQTILGYLFHHAPTGVGIHFVIKVPVNAPSSTYCLSHCYNNNNNNNNTSKGTVQESTGIELCTNLRVFDLSNNFTLLTVAGIHTDVLKKVTDLEELCPTITLRWRDTFIQSVCRIRQYFASQRREVGMPETTEPISTLDKRTCLFNCLITIDDPDDFDSFLSIVLLFIICAPQIAAQSPLSKVVDVNGSCENVNEPICQLQFTATKPNSITPMVKLEFFDAISSLAAGSCGKENDGYSVIVKDILTVQCSFIKRTNISIPPSEVFPGVMFPGLTYYYFATDFKPALGSSCSEPNDPHPCVGTLRIPALIQVLTLEVTTPVLKVDCGGLALVQSYGTNPVNSLSISPQDIPINNDDNGEVIIYLYFITVQDPSVLSIDCDMTLLKQDVTYTPHFYLSKDDHYLYSTSEIITPNIKVTLGDTCFQPDSALCDVELLTPYFADHQPIYTHIPQSLGSFSNPEYSETLSVEGEFSVYTQTLFKSISAKWYQLDIEDAANGDVTVSDQWVLDNPQHLSLQAVGQYLMGRKYQIDTTRVKYYEVVQVSIDQTLCSDPTVPFCRVYFTSQYHGPRLSLKLDKLPFNAVIDNIECLDNQMSIVTKGFESFIVFMQQERSNYSIVQPTLPPYPSSSSTYPKAIQCQIDFALRLDEDYSVANSPSIVPIKITHSQDLSAFRVNEWTPFDYLLQPVTSPAQLAFDTFPLGIHFDTANCKENYHARCTVYFTLSYDEYSDSIEHTYPRSFQFVLPGISTDEDLPIEATMTNASHPTIAVSRNGSTITVNLNTPVRKMKTIQAASPSQTFPFFDNTGTDVVIAITYSMEIDYIMDVADPPQLTSYAGLTLPTPLPLIDPALASLPPNEMYPRYIPPYKIVPQPDCTTVTSAICSLVIEPTDIIKNTPSDYTILSIDFSFDTVTSMGIAHDRLVGFDQCSLLTDLSTSKTTPQRLLFRCTFLSGGNAKTTTSKIPIINRLISTQSQLKVHLQSVQVIVSAGSPPESIELPDLKIHFPVLYKGDGYPEYHPECNIANGETCPVHFKMSTFPLRPSTTILQYSTLYARSFTSYEIINCTGADGKTSPNLDPVALAKAFSYSIIDDISDPENDGLLTFALGSALPDGLTELTSKTGQIDCLVVHYKRVQTGRLPSRVVPKIVMGVNFKQDYPLFPITGSSVQIPFTAIVYQPISATFGDFCFRVVPSSVDCVTTVQFNGSPGFPIASLAGEFDSQFLNKHRVLAMSITSLIPYQSIAASLPLGAKVPVDLAITPEYTLYMVNLPEIVGFWSEYKLFITGTTIIAATYNLYFHADPLNPQVYFYEVKVKPEYQTKSFSTQFTFAIDTTPFIAPFGLDRHALIQVPGFYPGVVNSNALSKAERVPWPVQPVAVGDPWECDYAPEFRRISGTPKSVPITYRFENAITSMVIDAQLWAKDVVVDCLLTDEFTHIPDSLVYTVGTKVATFSWDESRQGTRFTLIEAITDTTGLSCKVDLLVSSYYPSNSYQVRHYVFFAEIPEYEFFHAHDLPNYITGAVVSKTDPNDNGTPADTDTATHTSLFLATSMVIFTMAVYLL